MFLGIKVAITPPAVSIPNESGATSNKMTESKSLSVSPQRIAAYTAAPYATASSGLIDLFNYLPLKNSWSID